MKLHFSKNASHYDQYALIQKKMGDILIADMVHRQIIRKVRNILEIGCGTGYLTYGLTKHFPSAHITAVDIAPGMITEIKSRFSMNSVDFICGDIEEISLDQTYDIIISNATFQWFQNTPDTLKKLYRLLNVDGLLSFSTFGKYTFHELHTCFKKAGQALSIKEPISAGQSFYDYCELVALCENITADGAADECYHVQGRETFAYEYFHNCMEFFQSIKKTGASNSNPMGRVSSPAFMKEVMNCYDHNFMENGKIKATYHCIFISIMKNCSKDQQLN